MVKLLLVPTTLHNHKGQKIVSGPGGRILQGMSPQALTKRTQTSGWAVNRPKGN